MELIAFNFIMPISYRGCNDRQRQAAKFFFNMLVNTDCFSKVQKPLTVFCSFGLSSAFGRSALDASFGSLSLRAFAALSVGLSLGALAILLGGLRIGGLSFVFPGACALVILDGLSVGEIHVACRLRTSPTVTTKNIFSFDCIHSQVTESLVQTSVTSPMTHLSSVSLSRTRNNITKFEITM